MTREKAIKTAEQIGGHPCAQESVDAVELIYDVFDDHEAEIKTLKARIAELEAINKAMGSSSYMEHINKIQALSKELTELKSGVVAEFEADAEINEEWNKIIFSVSEMGIGLSCGPKPNHHKTYTVTIKEKKQ